ncbi:MAG: glycerophosphodiester phosphodiesterase [Bryobacteraceae bacterium]
MFRSIVLVTLAGVFSGALIGQMKPIEVHGHRGARAIFPENTMPAFEYAIQQGVDVLELDMGITKDGVVVVSHDPFVAKPTCSGPRERVLIHDLTLNELRQWDCGAIQNPEFATQRIVPSTPMPTLDEVLSLASKGSFRFNMETKISPEHPEATVPPEEFVRRVLAVVRKHHLEARVILQSFDYRTLREIKRLAPEIKRSALYNGPAKSFVEIGRESEADIVSPEHHLVTPDLVRAAQKAGFSVVPWTANRTQDWDRLIAAGVDAIITDDPAGLIARLKSRELQ